MVRLPVRSGDGEFWRGWSSITDGIQRENSEFAKWEALRVLSDPGNKLMF
jgi:hypothetical protein